MFSSIYHQSEHTTQKGGQGDRKSCPIKFWECFFWFSNNNNNTKNNNDQTTTTNNNNNNQTTTTTKQQQPNNKNNQTTTTKQQKQPNNNNQTTTTTKQQQQPNSLPNSSITNGRLMEFCQSEDLQQQDFVWSRDSNYICLLCKHDLILSTEFGFVFCFVLFLKTVEKKQKVKTQNKTRQKNIKTCPMKKKSEERPTCSHRGRSCKKQHLIWTIKLIQSKKKNKQQNKTNLLFVFWFVTHTKKKKKTKGRVFGNCWKQQLQKKQLTWPFCILKL